MKVGEGFVEARLVVQYAAQLVAAVGQSLGEKAPDDSQQSLSLDRGALDWLGMPIARGTLRAGLEPVRLDLRLCDGAGVPLETFPLPGRTLADGLSFLSAALERRGQRAAALALPKHRRFPSTGSDELVRLFADTHTILVELGQSAPVRLWPHHFDLACSRQFGAVSLGMGISPGDGATGLPYWYAKPWPMLDRLPPLAGGGAWHTEGWVGAELPLARLGASGQREQVLAFFQSSISAARGA